jgi:hypothetical protein
MGKGHVTGIIAAAGRRERGNEHAPDLPPDHKRQHPFETAPASRALAHGRVLEPMLIRDGNPIRIEVRPDTPALGFRVRLAGTGTNIRGVHHENAL